MEMQDFIEDFLFNTNQIVNPSLRKLQGKIERHEYDLRGPKGEDLIPARWPSATESAPGLGFVNLGDTITMNVRVN